MIIKDRVQFIKDGCPYINVSKLTDDEYRGLAELLNTLYTDSSDKLNNVTLEYAGSGKINLIGECPKCGTMNNWKNQDPFRPENYIYCESCGYNMNIIPADYIGDKLEDFFKQNMNSKIAIWPAKNAVKIMMEHSEAMSGDNIFIVDNSKFKQGGFIGDKIISSPSVIKTENIDTVIISITTPMSQEIIQEIKLNYPSVTRILYSGDVLKEELK